MSHFLLKRCRAKLSLRDKVFVVIRYITTFKKPFRLNPLFGRDLSYTAGGKILSETTIRNLAGKNLFIILPCR